jgi:DNA polymerase-3 subunit epsilon
MRRFWNNYSRSYNAKLADDKNIASEFARVVLDNKDNYLILDVETTGLDAKDVVIQIGIIDMDGNALLDSLVKPSLIMEISTNVTNITGIDMKMLSNAPTLRQLHPEIQEIVRNKQVLVYNAGFAKKYLILSSWQDGFQIEGINLMDVANYYAMFQGKWIEERDACKIPLISTDDKSVIGDCRATMNALSQMAQFDSVRFLKTKSWWKFWN